MIITDSAHSGNVYTCYACNSKFTSNKLYTKYSTVFCITCDADVPSIERHISRSKKHHTLLSSTSPTEYPLCVTCTAYLITCHSCMNKFVECNQSARDYLHNTNFKTCPACPNNNDIVDLRQHLSSTEHNSHHHEALYYPTCPSCMLIVRCHICNNINHSQHRSTVLRRNQFVFVPRFCYTCDIYFDTLDEIKLHIDTDEHFEKIKCDEFEYPKCPSCKFVKCHICTRPVQNIGFRTTFCYVCKCNRHSRSMKRHIQTLPHQTLLQKNVERIPLCDACSPPIETVCNICGQHIVIERHSDLYMRAKTKSDSNVCSYCHTCCVRLDNVSTLRDHILANKSAHMFCANVDRIPCCQDCTDQVSVTHNQVICHVCSERCDWSQTSHDNRPLCWCFICSEDYGSQVSFNAHLTPEHRLEIVNTTNAERPICPDCSVIRCEICTKFFSNDGFQTDLCHTCSQPMSKDLKRTHIMSPAHDLQILNVFKGEATHINQTVVRCISCRCSHCNLCGRQIADTSFIPFTCYLCDIRFLDNADENIFIQWVRHCREHQIIHRN